MATGKATIRGRTTSLSGRKVSEYSPQHKSITGKDAPDRGTTSAQVMLADDLTQAQKDAARNTSKSYAQVKAEAKAEAIAASQDQITRSKEGVTSYYTPLTESQRDIRYAEYQARLAAGKTGQTQSTQKVDAYVNRNSNKSSNKSAPAVPLLAADGKTVIKQIEFGRGNSHIVGIRGVAMQLDAAGNITDKKAISDAERKRAYKERVESGKPSRKTNKAWKAKLENTARSMITSESVMTANKIEKYANMPITSGTNAIDKRRINLARNVIYASLPESQRETYYQQMKEFDNSVKALKAKTGFSNAKISRIISGKVQLESEGPLKKYSTLATKAEKDQRYKDYQKRLEQKALDNELIRYAGDSKIKGVLADIYRATRDIDSLKATSEANTRKWNRDFEQATNKKQLTWSQGSVNALTNLQNYTERLVKAEKHPYLEIGENTLQMVESVPIGLLKAADYGIQTKGKSVIPQAKAFVQGTVEFPFVVVGAGNRVLKPGGLRDFEALQTLSNAAAMLLIGRYGGRVVTKVKSPIGLKPTKLQEVSAGEAAAVRDIKTGYALTVRGNPVISYSKSTRKIQRGAAGVPIKTLEGKQVQAFNKADTKAFEATLKQLDKIEQTYYKSGKKIADVAYKQKKPVTKPKQLEILSEHIPANMKPIVKDTITKYGGLLKRRDIQVYGSVPQKLQMEGFFTRSPKDIEISVSNTKSFVSQFRRRANQKGFKENTDYRITGNEGSPKVEFKINGKWEKGIEVFPNSKKGLSEAYNLEAGYRLQDGIAYGFKDKKSLHVGGKLGIGGTKVMKLQEQAARKFAGGNVLKDGKFGPMHPGRVKDVRDLIEMGTAYEVKMKVGISKEIIQYSRIAAKKHPEILESPIINHIVKNGKIPTEAQIKLMTSKAEAATGAIKKELIFESRSRGVGFSKRSLNSLSTLSAISKTLKASVVGSSVSKGMSRSASKTSAASRSTSRTASKSVSKPSTVRSRSTVKSGSVSKLSASKSKQSVSKTSQISKPSVSRSSVSRSSKSVSTSSKSGGSGSKYTPPPEKLIKPIIKRRSKKNLTNSVKDSRKIIRAHRKFTNTLGSFESMFGTSKAKAKPKPVTRAKPKTVKAGSQSTRKQRK